MALTAATFYRHQIRNLSGSGSYPIENGETIYHGSLVGIDINTGRIQRWNTNSNALKFLGVSTSNENSLDGNAAGTIEGLVDESGLTLEQVAVTGVSGQQMVGELVYATDDNTFTLTATSNVGAIGRVKRWYSSTTADVELWTPAEYRAQEDS